MALAARIEELPRSAGRPRDPRRAIRLETVGALAAGDAAEVTVHNISVTGMLIECGEELGIGELLSIDLPHAEGRVAKVVWNSGRLHGCEFDEPVSKAVLSAAQLQGAVGQVPDVFAQQDAASAEPFSERLQRLRKERGLSLAQIALELGVSKPTVWAWEQGRARPVAGRIERLAQLLGVTGEELLSGRDEAELSGILARCRQQIAGLFGTRPESVRIMIEL